MRRLNALLALAIGLSWLWTTSAQGQGRGKDIVVALGAEPRTMLAVTIVDWTTNNMLEHIYDRLLDRDPKTLKPKPMLATGWKIVNDTTWEFALRQGVKFHNGEPFNAQSVKATLEYAQTYASYGNNQVIDEKIARAVTIVDPKGRAAAYAELQKLVRDEAPWVFLWQQHDLYGVANHVDWTPRADEKMWMYEAKVVAK